MSAAPFPTHEHLAGNALDRYRPWFYAAALYNFVWGSLNVIFPELFFLLVGMPPPNYPPLWQVVGMFVLVYAPAYWWAARFPARHPHLIAIGLLGKLLGPLGFASPGGRRRRAAGGRRVVRSDWPEVPSPCATVWR